MTTQQRISFTIEPFIYTLSVYEKRAELKAIHHEKFYKWVLIFPNINGVYISKSSTIDVNIFLKVILHCATNVNDARSMSTISQSYGDQDQILLIRFACICQGFTRNVILELIPKKPSEKIVTNETNTVVDEPAVTLIDITLIAHEKIKNISNMMENVKETMDPRTLMKNDKIPYIDESINLVNEIKELMIEESVRRKYGVNERKKIFSVH
jgi:hypothetical protein